MSVPKSSDPGSHHQRQPLLRQHFLKRLPEPQGQRSFRPSFSSSSLSPWTTRTPRLTCVSDGNPRRRLLIGSKKMAVRRIVHDSCVAWRTSSSRRPVILQVTRVSKESSLARLGFPFTPFLSKSLATATVEQFAIATEQNPKPQRMI